MELQSSNENQTPPENAVNQDLAQVIQESKENIQAAEMVPPKRRGRPKKDPNAPATTRVKASGGAGPSIAPGTSPVAPPDISKSLIVPLAMLSKIPADATKVPELMLEKDEAEALAKSLSDLYAAFAPAGQMDPKTAAVCNFGLVAGSIFLTKYQIYLEKRPKKTPDQKPTEEMQRINPEQPFPRISAEQAFRKNPTQ